MAAKKVKKPIKKWDDSLYDSMERVGCDLTKSDVLACLKKEFKADPEILDRVARAFAKGCPSDDDWYSCQ